MPIRTEGQIVAAANGAMDLTNIVIAYLELYKQHAQGLNGVTIPDGHYTVVFWPIREEGRLPVKVIYTKTQTWQVAEYYDVDSDYFSDSLAASNISGYSTRCSSSTEECDFSIPFSALLQSREEMERGIKAFAERKQTELREKERQRQIAEHEAAIRALQRS